MDWCIFFNQFHRCNSHRNCSRNSFHYSVSVSFCDLQTQGMYLSSTYVYAEIIVLQINQAWWSKMLCIDDLLFYLIYRLVDRIWIHLLWAVVPHCVARCQEVLFLKIMVIKSLKKSLVKEVQLLPRQQILVMVSLIMNRNMNIRIFSREPIL